MPLPGFQAFPPLADVTPVTLTYRATVNDAANATVYTITQATHGVSTTDGVVVVGVGGGNSVDVTGVTMNGVAMTRQVGTGASVRHASLWSIAHRGGNLGDIVVTFGAAATRCNIGIWSILGAGGITASDTGTGDTTDPLEDTLSVPVGGCAIALVVSSAGGAFTWTNITENYDTTSEGTNQVSGASDNYASGGTITPSANASGALTDGQIVAAAWGP